MNRKPIIFFIIIFTGIMVASSCLACTDVKIKTKDGSIIIGRSMEFAIELNSEVIVHPKGEKRSTKTPNGKTGLKWKSKYGFISVNGFGADAVVDGMNEAGLAVEFLWFPDAKYQEVKKGKESKALSILDLGAWILGNFATVDEAKKAIQDISVWGEVLPGLGIVPPLHLAINDAKGNSIVIEFINGEQKIYDNPIGVLTNAPAFDWHITNLRNYVGLTAYNVEPVSVGGMTFKAAGQGSGVFGIPGDWTPPSRFVRAAAFAHLAEPAKDASEGVILIQHIMSAVDIPRGVIRETKDGKLLEESTQWVVIKDLNNKMFYFRSYDDFALRTVNLKKLNLKPGAKSKSISIRAGSEVKDMTDKLK